MNHIPTSAVFLSPSRAVFPCESGLPIRVDGGPQSAIDPLIPANLRGGRPAHLLARATPCVHLVAGSGGGVRAGLKFTEARRLLRKHAEDPQQRLDLGDD